MAPFSTAQLMASAIWSLEPPPVPRYFSDQRLFDAGGDTDSRSVDVAAKNRSGAVGAMAMLVIRTRRGEIFLDQRHTGERGMAGIDAGIKYRDHDSVAGERRG